MDFAAIFTALKAWWAQVGVTDANGFRAIQVVHAQEPRPMVNQRTGAIVLLDLVSITQLGEDHVSRAVINVVGASKLLPTYGQLRQLVVSVQVDASTQDFARHAVTFIERGRRHLNLAHAAAAFRAAGIAVANVGDTIVTSYEFDGRMRSRATFDLTLNAWSQETEATESATDTIGSVTVQSDTLQTTDGSDHADQIDVTVTEEP